MPYDKEICDDYVKWLDSLKHYKAQAKEWDKHIAALNLLTDEFEEGRAGYKALMTLHRIVIQRKNSINRSLVIVKKELDKATKAYQEYCANKETK
jgi:hypothetical protein